jgi:hypothetical protein
MPQLYTFEVPAVVTVVAKTEAEARNILGDSMRLQKDDTDIGQVKVWLDGNERLVKLIMSEISNA